MFGGIPGCSGFILCYKRLRLSRQVDECKPLPVKSAPSAYALDITVSCMFVPARKVVHEIRPFTVCS